MRRLKVFGIAVVIALCVFGSFHIGGAFWIHSKAILAQILLERAWELRLAGASDDITKPWPWADTKPIARLQVPDLGIDQIILSGASGRSLAFGPGHISGTALPGRAGHSIVSGHRDTHFTFLKNLAKDDKVNIQRDDGHTVSYRVTGRQVIDARKSRFSEAPSKTVISLVTCYPFAAIRPNGSLRLVVFAEAFQDHKT